MKTTIKLTSILLAGSINIDLVTQAVDKVAKGDRRLFIYSISFQEKNGTYKLQLENGLNEAVIHIFGIIGNLEDNLVSELKNVVDHVDIIEDDRFELWKAELEKEFVYAEYYF